VVSVSARCRVHDGVRKTALCLVFFAAACGRSGLEPAFAPGAPLVIAPDAAIEHAPDRPADMAMEHAPDAPPDALPDAAAEHPAPPACVPTTEICNGVDDDCNGQVDENLPAIPCPNGGYQYCVAGRYSDCPRRCEVCVPGSSITCFTSFCTFWGKQACAPDGRSFGACQEDKAVPPECQDVAKNMQRSAALEQCCIENGYCCLDSFDLNNNGDRNEMLGHCEAVTCGP
jgi:hypothetical protein